MIFLVITSISIAQTSDSTINNNNWMISGFADLYYSYDFNEPKDHKKPGFLYSHSSHNEFALNNALFIIKYAKRKVRGTFGFQTGTYVRQNYSNEPTIFQLIYEANAGYEIAPSLWVDAGIFPSHIGVESALSFNNFTLTRSMMAENTPYYETGVKLTFHPSSKLTLSCLVLNGWQNIVENNDNKALGTQVQFRPFKNVLLNSSTFFGKEIPAFDTLSTYRFFHDFYTQIDFNKISFIAAFDIGFQKSYLWYSPNFIVRYSPIGKTAFAARIEYYVDRNEVIINTDTENGFKTLSSSINFDYKLTPNIAWRTEARVFNSKDKLFIKNSKSVKYNSNVITSLAIKF